MNPFVAIGTVLVVLLTAVIGFVIWRNATEQKQSVDQVNQTMSDIATFTVGKDSAPVKLDVVEDFMCPSCRQFEASFGRELHRRVDAGEITVRYHVVNFLDRASASGNYSTRALAAAMYVSEHAPDNWVAFQAELFRNQPEEGGDKDLTDNQIADLAIKAGVPYDTAQKLRDLGPLLPPARAAATKTMDYIDDNVHRVSTPMVIRDGKEIEVTAGWLNDVK